MTGHQPGSWASRILGFALMVLVAAWALNVAARLLVAVLPVLSGLAVAALGAFMAVRLLRNR